MTMSLKPSFFPQFHFLPLSASCSSHYILILLPPPPPLPPPNEMTSVLISSSCMIQVARAFLPYAAEITVASQVALAAAAAAGIAD
jgi:hypothetical protein